MAYLDKTGVEEMLQAMAPKIYHYKGTVTAEENLPTDNNMVCDVYMIPATDTTPVKIVWWTGTEWSPFGGADVEPITQADLEEIVNGVFG